MNKKIQNMSGPGTRIFLLILLVFACVTLFFNHYIAIAELAVVVLLLFWAFLTGRKQRRELVKYIEEVTYNAESAKNNTLMNFPLPIATFKLEDYRIVWANQIFFSMFGASRPSLDSYMTALVPNFSTRWLMEGKNQCPELITVGDRKYQLHGNIIRGKNDEQTQSGFMGITYWVDVTDFDSVKQEYENSRPIAMILLVDNYDELMKNLSDRDRVAMRGKLDDMISNWCSGTGGLMRRYDRDRYMFIFESRYLAAMTEKKFNILDKIHQIVNQQGIHATLSIGVGRDGASFEEDFSFANLSIEMALSRGGDQAVIKNRFNFEFYGGRGTEIETRTKVKARVTVNALAGLIKDSGQVFVMGHKVSDLDCVGAAAGMCCIVRKLERPVKVVVDRKTTAAGALIELLLREPEYKDTFITPEEAIVRADSHTLLVVVDTNRPEQVESQTLLEACNKVAVIDHHRRAASYIQNPTVSFHEPYASSACELMTELMQETVEQTDITRTEAEAVMSGIVLDTKNFTIRTGERTFDAAAFLRRAGADTTEVKKLLQNDMAHNVARFKILQGAKLYRDSIAISVPQEPQDRIVAAQAADELLNISGVSASIVAYPTAEGGAVVSARSIGDVNVQLLLEKLGGGGNKSTAGAQVSNMPIRDVVNTICKSIDEYFET